MAVILVGAGIAATGLLITFAGDRVRGRLIGLTVMGVGALTVLAAAGPRDGGTGGTVVLTAITLAGMLAFAGSLLRRLDGGPDAGIDEPHDGPSDEGSDEGRR